MRSPSEQVSEGQPGATELLIKPDAEIVQSHPRRQTCSQSLKLMRPLPPQAKGVEQLVVGALYDLADGGHPSPQMLGPGLERVSFGRMDDARPVALSPAAVVLGSFETFVGYVGSRGDRSYTGKALVLLSPHSKESLGHLLVGGRGGSKAENRDDSRGICSGEQRKAFVPSQAVGPSDVGLSSKPSMSSAFTVSGGHRRAVQRLVRALSHLKKSYQVQEESLHELRVRAHQPIELGTLGKGGEGICEVGLGVAVEVPLAGEPRPAGEEGEGDDLARTERCVWSWLPFWCVGLAEVVDRNVKCSEEGVHIEHEGSVPFPSGLGGKPTLECGHLPLKFRTGNSHQAFKGHGLVSRASGRPAMRWCRLATNSSGGTLNSVSSPRCTTSQNSARASGDSLSIRPAISSSITPQKVRDRDTPKDTPALQKGLVDRSYSRRPLPSSFLLR